MSIRHRDVYLAGGGDGVFTTQPYSEYHVVPVPQQSPLVQSVKDFAAAAPPDALPGVLEPAVEAAVGAPDKSGAGIESSSKFVSSRRLISSHTKYI